MAKPKRDLRPMHRAAYAGDHDAARAVLKLYGFGVARLRALSFSTINEARGEAKQIR